MIPRPLFDRPVWRDPLFSGGVGVGLVVGVVMGVRAELPLEEFLWYVFAGTFSGTYWIAGFMLSTVRHQFRRRRTVNETDVEVISS